MTQTAPNFTFKPGDKVSVLLDPPRMGPIIAGPRVFGAIREYEVWIDNEAKWCDERHLEPLPNLETPRLVSADEFLRAITLAKLRNPLTDAFYAYRASRTDFQAYQFRPALKFLRSESQRLLIADEVGLGKTIEAAIIYLELQARLDISRVLVLCPSRLMMKWKDELRNRFEEDFELLDVAKMRHRLEDFQRHGTGMRLKGIVSFESMRRDEFIDAFSDSGLPLDLLIVDEAHYLRNSESRTFELGRALTSTAEATLFLTATPLHLRNRDLFNLLNLLAPDDFPEQALFEDLVAPNRHINTAAKHAASGRFREAGIELSRVEETKLRERFTLNPFYRETLRRLEASTLNSASPQQRVETQWELLQLNTLSSILTRTRKREVTSAAIRAPYSIKIELTPDERALYDAVLNETRNELRSRGSSARGFGAIQKERQAASCLPALSGLIRDAVHKRGSVQLPIDVSPFELTDDTAGPVRIDESLSSLVARASSIDSKFAKFEATLRGALAEDPASKALVFSYFKGTLRYLDERLRKLGLQPLMIHGEVPVAQRHRIIDEFRTDPGRRVMLSSEVGAEGLDFQFCDILVNYDLPWNPMQLEQRIGRLDRFGQEHPRIRIYNLLIDDTIETRIFDRLYERIELFKHSIGDLEAILGEEIRALSKEVLQSQLTPAEEIRLADSAADRILQLQHAEAELEKQKDELLGQGAIFDSRIERSIAAGRYISSDEVRAIVQTYIRECHHRSTFVFDHEEPCATLELDPQLSVTLSKFIERKKLSNVVSSHLRSVLSGQRRIALTFDADLARQRSALEFITVRHPLAALAIEHWNQSLATGLPYTTVTLTREAVRPETGQFFIYLVDVHGLNQSTTLHSVVVTTSGEISEELGEFLLAAIQRGTTIPTPNDLDPTSYHSAEVLAQSWMSDKRRRLEKELERRNEATYAARTASVRRSFESKINRTLGYATAASDERIRRMRRSEVDNLKARMEHKLTELGRSRQPVVSYRLLAAGGVRVVPAS